MKVLIVEKDTQLGRLWSGHINRMGAQTTLTISEGQAIRALREEPFDILVLDLNLHESGAMALSDYASYRRPDMKIIFVTSCTFFSDGSIFDYMSNACAMVSPNTSPEDMAALVDYHGRPAAVAV